jgi:pimeloyl-ACP methyl ester carboxylesterase
MPDRLLRILPEVKVQLDSIWGEFDRPHPDPEVQEEVLRRFDPGLDFRTIADAGHWVMYERPEAFNAALLDMLSQPLRKGS